MARRRPPKHDPADEDRKRIEANRAAAEDAFGGFRGYQRLSHWPPAFRPDAVGVLLRPLAAELALVTKAGREYARISGFGAIDAAAKRVFLNPTVPGEHGVDDWAYVLLHLLLHLGLEHHLTPADAALRAAREAQVDALAASLGVVSRPPGYTPLDMPGDDAERTAERLRAGALGPVPLFTLAGPDRDDVILAPNAVGFADRFAEGLEALVGLRAEQLQPGRRKGERSIAEQARAYVINRYPLLAGMAAQIRIISDPAIVNREGVESAAVNPRLGEIYLSVDNGTTLREAVFLLGHELLHLGLRHADRIGGRDPFIWNLACDFKCNQYLVEMGVGVMPQFGALYDPALGTLSAESIYDHLVTHVGSKRGHQSKYRTYAGLGRGDMILAGPRVVLRGDVTTLEDAWVRALCFGLDACRIGGGTWGRGLIPAELEEEIEALDVAPIAWDVALAHWFEANVRSPEPVRTYARASRRQAATPDIPRPRYWTPEWIVRQATFGVILDTSASMDRERLATALGAIAAYAESRAVRWVRLVHCDASPYDDGYVDTDEFRRRYPVKGRGGTVLFPAVQYLLAQPDFPPDAPVLLLSDGECEPDMPPIPRTHAWVLPTDGWVVPPRTGGEVFRVL